MNYQKSEDYERKVASEENLHIQMLWEQYDREPTENNLSELFLACEPFIEKISSIYTRKFIEVAPSLKEDTISESHVRFMKLLTSYEDEGSLFTTILGENIKGAALDEQRATFNRMNNVKRRDYDKIKSVAHIKKENGFESGHQVAVHIFNTPEIISDTPWNTKPWTLETLETEIKTLESLNQSSVSLDNNAATDSENHSLTDIIEDKNQRLPEDTLDSDLSEEQLILRQAAQHLTNPKLKYVFQELIEKERTARDLAKEFEVSESRISQLKNEITVQLKKIIISGRYNQAVLNNQNTDDATAPTEIIAAPQPTTVSTAFKQETEKESANDSLTLSPTDMSNLDPVPTMTVPNTDRESANDSSLALAGFLNNRKLG